MMACYRKINMHSFLVSVLQKVTMLFNKEALSQKSHGQTGSSFAQISMVADDVLVSFNGGTFWIQITMIYDLFLYQKFH